MGPRASMPIPKNREKTLKPPLRKGRRKYEKNDEALLMYTSGSTGKPKGVIHTHRSIVENIKIEVGKFYFDENSRGILHFPINHVAADVEIGFGAIMSGGCIVCMDRFDPVETLKVIEKEKITHVGQVPVMFLLEFKQPEFWKCDFSSVQGLCLGRCCSAENHDRPSHAHMPEDRGHAPYRVREHGSLRLHHLHRKG